MILHIDMDAFFAAVEQRDNPALRGKPVIVSGNSKRSVVSTASYEARKFGIHSAMPVFQAKQRCSHLIIVPGNRQKYVEDSRRIMTILREFSPLVEPVSIDEAYLDIQGCEKLFGPPKEMASKIKQAVFNDLSLTCSIGIAPVKFLAKIASDMNKPDGVTFIPKESMDDVIKNLEIRKVPGVGKQAMTQMQSLQISTLGDVQKFDPSLLTRKLGKMGQRLFQLSKGIDDTPIETHSIRKSISGETTLSEDISTLAAARRIILDQAQRVGRDLRNKNLVCRNVSIKIKFSDFTQITRSKKTNSWICSSTAIFDEAMKLYGKVIIKKKIRLLGVGVSVFQDSSVPVQMSLLSSQDEKTGEQWESVDKAVDSISHKFGSDMIKKATQKETCHIKSGNKGKKDSDIYAVMIIVTGRVQGVYFRASTQTAAKSRNLKGWVKNLKDGSVHALFQGTKADVDGMVKWCWQGPPNALVNTVTSKAVPVDQALTSFAVLY